MVRIDGERAWDEMWIKNKNGQLGEQTLEPEVQATPLHATDQ